LPGTAPRQQSGTRVTHRSYGNDEVCSSTVSCRWYRSGRVRSGPWPTFTSALAGAYVSEFRRTKSTESVCACAPRTKETNRLALARRGPRKRIGLRLRAEDKGNGSACARALRTKRTNRLALARRGHRKWIGLHLHAKDKGNGSASACSPSTTTTDRRALARRGRRQRIGRRSNAEDEEDGPMCALRKGQELVCACALRKKAGTGMRLRAEGKGRNWYALAR
jgi:hypothetical protein